MLLPVSERQFYLFDMLNAQKVLALNVDALLISFICMLMLLILSLHQERTDRDKIKRFSFFGRIPVVLENRSSSRGGVRTLHFFLGVNSE